MRTASAPPLCVLLALGAACAGGAPRAGSAAAPGSAGAATSPAGEAGGASAAAGSPAAVAAAAAAAVAGDIDPGPGTDTDKAGRRCANIAAAATAQRAVVGAAGAASPRRAAAVSRAAAAPGWLTTRGNQILTSDGTPFRGRGVNLPDPRGCGACACNAVTLQASVAEVLRRIDTLVADWQVNFLRLALESYPVANIGVLGDPDYLAAIQQVVAHIEGKPGVYVEVSVWFDPSLDANGWPTDTTNQILTTLVGAIGQSPRVLFGICNEPQKNSDGAMDAQVWARMNAAAAAIRAAEAALPAPAHIILAQGTGGWSRFLAYYQTHPLTAGDGGNIAYEVHVYDPATTFAARFVGPSQVLPVVISEFGPLEGSMTLEDTAALMAQAEAAGVPYLAWTFHGRCLPGLLMDTSGGGCGIGMPLVPSAWGQQLKDRLASPWVG